MDIETAPPIAEDGIHCSACGFEVEGGDHWCPCLDSLVPTDPTGIDCWEAYEGPEDYEPSPYDGTYSEI